MRLAPACSEHAECTFRWTNVIPASPPNPQGPPPRAPWPPPGPPPPLPAPHSLLLSGPHGHGLPPISRSTDSRRARGRPQAEAPRVMGDAVETADGAAADDGPEPVP